jgi:hypothetical protein
VIDISELRLEEIKKREVFACEKEGVGQAFEGPYERVCLKTTKFHSGL